MRNLQQRFYVFLTKLENLPVYEFEGKNYIELDEFMKVWEKFVGRN